MQLALAIYSPNNYIEIPTGPSLVPANANVTITILCV